MSAAFEELSWCPTPSGTISLRRRREPALGVDVYEVKLGDEFLMSSLFTESEVALARLGLAGLEQDRLDVVVGGLGLGYTAGAVLDHAHVASLLVVDLLEPVIGWHRDEILPLSPNLNKDPRCRLIHGDFFALAESEAGFDPDAPCRRFHAILLDIDHAPNFLLDPRNAAFYEREGLRRLAGHLHAGGVFGLWSNELPDEAFIACLGGVFASVRAELVTFHNPLQNRPVTQTIYIAVK